MRGATVNAESLGANLGMAISKGVILLAYHAVICFNCCQHFFAISSLKRNVMNYNRIHKGRLLRAIKQAGNQSELARQAGISVSYISEVYAGRKPPSNQFATAIRDATGINVLR